jgi:hypothetical protein
MVKNQKSENQKTDKSDKNNLLQPLSTHMDSSVSVRISRKPGISARWERMMIHEKTHKVLMEGMYEGVSGQWAKPGASGKWQRDGISGVWRRPGQSSRSSRNDILDKW